MEAHAVDAILLYSGSQSSIKEASGGFMRTLQDNSIRQALPK